MAELKDFKDLVEKVFTFNGLKIYGYLFLIALFLYLYDSFTDASIYSKLDSKIKILEGLIKVKPEDRGDNNPGIDSLYNHILQKTLALAKEEKDFRLTGISFTSLSQRRLYLVEIFSLFLLPIILIISLLLGTNFSEKERSYYALSSAFILGLVFVIPKIIWLPVFSSIYLNSAIYILVESLIFFLMLRIGIALKILDRKT